MDDAYHYNKARWEALVRAQALFTRPWLDLDEATARGRLDRWDILGELAGKRVLCLAGGGGQQSAAFGVLGATVSVVDISDGQLARDRGAAAHYGFPIQTYQGDMRHLAMFADDSFDLVWQPYSLNFVPDCRPVFDEVARVLRPGGLYHVMAANPSAAGMGPRDWNGDGYLVRRPYIEGAEINYPDEPWVFRAEPAAANRVEGPREYRQTLGRLVNGLVEAQFVIIRLSEWAGHEPDPDATPGAWEHFTAFLPPWLSFWAIYKPDLAFRFA